MCVISAVGIAAIDGPAPFMDAAAASYFSACLIRAGRDMDRCYELEPIL